ncbi:phosphoribosylaminoimidazolesuccinocarboxamide synthase [soil metagenome]
MCDTAAVSIDGLPLLASGKVRDVYEVDDEHLLMVASDRISAYDVVLPTPIPDKGAVLTALSAWWFGRLAGLGPHHLVSVTDGVPAAVRGRAMLVRRLAMLPIECVARGYLAGSGRTEHAATGGLCGIALPPGLTDGSRLPEPIFTPATKAAAGAHDENIGFAQVAAAVGTERAGQLSQRTLAVYTVAARITAEQGILLADTKLEFGLDPGGALVLGDEVLTPDSSRLWPAESWSPGRPQLSYDKQYVRDWLVHESGWDRQGPAPELPAEVVAATRARYILAYERLTGLSFTDWTGLTSAQP